MAQKLPPTGRTTAPPPVTGIALELSSPDGPIGATSIYESHGLLDSGGGDALVVLVDKGRVPIVTLSAPAEIRPPRRAVPFALTHGRPAPTIVPTDPTAVDADGPWTVGEPPPSDAPFIRRVVRVVQDAPPGV